MQFDRDNIMGNAIDNTIRMSHQQNDYNDNDDLRKKQYNRDVNYNNNNIICNFIDDTSFCWFQLG